MAYSHGLVQALEMRHMKETKFKDIQEFYSFIKAITGKLSDNGFSNISEIINHRMYKVSWTTGSELLEELENVFSEFKKESWSLVSDELKSDINDCLEYLKLVLKSQ
jgi:hypothetical protein